MDFSNRKTADSRSHGASAPGGVSCGCETAAPAGTSHGCETAAPAGTSCGCETVAPASASCGCGQKLPGPAPEAGLVLAMATVPMEPWENIYEPAVALRQGTIFPGLDKPFYVTGGGGLV